MSINLEHFSYLFAQEEQKSTATKEKSAEDSPNWHVPAAKRPIRTAPKKSSAKRSSTTRAKKTKKT